LLTSGRSPQATKPRPTVRDAITSLHNLEVLLKSPRVSPKVLEGVLPELFEGASVLRGAFATAAQAAGHAEALQARRELEAFTAARLDELAAVHLEELVGLAPSMEELWRRVGPVHDSAPA